MGHAGETGLQIVGEASRNGGSCFDEPVPYAWHFGVGRLNRCQVGACAEEEVASQSVGDSWEWVVSKWMAGRASMPRMDWIELLNVEAAQAKRN